VPLRPIANAARNPAQPSLRERTSTSARNPPFVGLELAAVFILGEPPSPHLTYLITHLTYLIITARVGLITTSAR
jgi:hypothetical protein